jgi:hypothetical protein
MPDWARFVGLRGEWFLEKLREEAVCGVLCVEFGQMVRDKIFLFNAQTRCHFRYASVEAFSPWSS